MRSKIGWLQASYRFQKGERAELFDAEGPLGSLSAKIKLLHATSTIGGESRADLVILKNVRNVFAHASSHVTFETGEIADACSRLTLIEKVPENVRANAKVPSDEEYPLNASRQKFLSSCVLYSSVLKWQAEDLEEERAEDLEDERANVGPEPSL
jgi:DNA-binding MltR family transcriptional regulator